MYGDVEVAMEPVGPVLRATAVPAGRVAATHEVLLDVRGLSKRFGGLVATDDVSLALGRGIITSLVGPNGAGKTTLFNEITGHIVPDSGDIVWQGTSVVGVPPWKIARAGIARTFQDLRLFTEMTVEENVLAVTETSSWFWQPGGAAGRRQRRERTADVLLRVGLADKAGSRAGELSYAERKFLSLARVMATDAPLWLLDEPASGLDMRSYDRFCELVRAEVERGKTMCIIEHNLDIVVRISDRIAFLDQGRLLAIGEPSEILGRADLSAIYFGDR
jgi:branched-chain amino acid transport system ATP-binding protein